MPLDRGEIDRQLEALGEGGRWWSQRELRDLPLVLGPGEEILALARGKIARPRWVRRSWLVVVTNRRLLFMRSGVSGGWRQEEVPVGQITRVTLRVGPFRGRLRVSTAGRRYGVLVPRADAYRIHAALVRVVIPSLPVESGLLPTAMVRRVFDHVLALPAAALDPQPQKAVAVPAVDRARVDERLHALEAEVQELREQVDFLEQLLRERHPELSAGR